MRVLLSTIGSRGEAQPVTALAVQLRAHDQDVRVCAPPDFRELVAGQGIPFTPIGPELRPTAAPKAPAIFGPEQRRQLIEGTVAAQFTTITEAAEGCDLLVGCGALQVAAPSIAERQGIGYVHAHFCPISLPSPHHAPPQIWGPVDETASNAELWASDAQRWNDHWGTALNTHRAEAGLAPVEDVRGHVFTDRPWLAADPTLGPWPGDADVFQTGAWILPDGRPLSAELQAFLDAGDPPVYFGLGSMAAPGEDIGQVMVKAARDAGHRAIISRGWADLPLPDDGRDCILIGEANHQALFPRVAAVVHHGGAGTTTAVARAGVPHVVVPQRYDQPYWAKRVEDLGIGVAHAQGMPAADALATAISKAVELTAPAQAVAAAVRTDGARVAARRLLGL